MKAVAIVSGGLDSVTLAHHLDAEHPGIELHLVSFNYGQRHRKELEFAAECADRLGARHDIVELSGITRLIATSSLTSGDVAVPDGHYAEDTMRATVVPNRNMMMLSIAAGIAISDGAEFVATGVHGGDHFIYPDCRPEFIAAANAAVLVGNAGYSPAGFRGVVAPFVHYDKAWIARRAEVLGLPIERTWSCYKGGEVHCGRCGTCVERIEALHLAGVDDPTEYADPDFWQLAVAERAAGIR